MSTEPPVSPATAAPNPRFVVMDVLRGVALCGIVWMNLQPVTRMGTEAATFSGGSLQEFLDGAVHGRFIGMFAVLFGLSSALFLTSAAARTTHPRRVLLRRFAFLLALGLLHAPFHPGEVLSSYAVAGLVLLLPLSFTTWRRVPLIAGVVLVVAAGAAGMEPPMSWIGLLLAGFGAGRLGLPVLLERGGRGPLIALAVAAVLAVAAAAWQQTYVAPFDPAGTPLYSRADYTAGVLGAIAYGLLIVVLCVTPARAVLRRVFEPVGRMALSNYLGATVLALLASAVLDLPTTDNLWPILPLGLTILVLQRILSGWWLRNFRYGPVEWVWRCVSWWAVVPNRRPAVPQDLALSSP